MDDAIDETTPEPLHGVGAADPAPAPRRRRLLALWGALAVLAIGGGALVVSAADDDPPRLPVALGSAAQEGRGSTAAADLSMMAWIRYIAGEDLPQLGGSAVAYRLSGDVDRGEVERLAEALDLDAEVVRSESGWRAGSADGVLEVYEGNGGSWWYSATPSDAVARGTAGSSGSASGSGSSGCAPDELECSTSSLDAPVTTLANPPVCDADGKCDVIDPIEPAPTTPPEDLPSKAEAQEIALELFRSTGSDVDGAKVTVDGPYDAWYVSVEPKVDGLSASGLYLNASVGSKGEITSAGGILHSPERLGSYPVVDTATVIERLNAGTAYGGGAVTDLAVAEGRASEPAVETEVAPTEPADTTIVAPDEGVAFDPGIACDDAGGTADPIPDTTIPDTTIAPDPAITDCSTTSYQPPSGPIEVVLHDAERILVLLPAFDGTNDSYLVPGYRMTGDDGATVEAPAVDDESLLPVDDVPTPDPDQPVGDPGMGTTEPATRCAQPEPGPNGEVLDICLDPNSVPETTVPVGEG